MPDEPLATVVILTYNGETYLERILDSVLAQDVDGEVEVLVLDSGSTDGTLEIVSRFPSVILKQIPNSEFGHGKTRNLAARLAKGTYVVYLTHDAIPLHNKWLRRLLEPFELNPRVVAVTGRQVPRRDCFPVQKYEIQGAFLKLGSVAGVTLFQADPMIPSESQYLVAFYSDVNAASRRRFLVEELPYRDVRYAEDQLFGKDVIDSGYIKAYAASAAVEHSNDLTLSEYGKRIFDETVGLRQIGFDIARVTLGSAVVHACFGILADAYRILRDTEYTKPRKLYWLFANPSFQVRKWQSLRHASAVNLHDHAAIAAGSLEHSRKQGQLPDTK